MAKHDGIIPPWPNRADLREFAKSMVLGFGGLAILLGLLLRNAVVAGWLAGIGGGTALLALVLPPVAAPIYMVWHTVTGAIGWVNSRLILGILFYCVFTPVGLILRVIGKDPLVRKAKPDTESYWSDRDRTIDKDRYERQF